MSGYLLRAASGRTLYLAGDTVLYEEVEAINHCIQTRADLHQRLHDERLTEHVTVPEDGAAVPIDATPR